MKRKHSALSSFMLLATAFNSLSTNAQATKDTVLSNGNHVPFLRMGTYPDEAFDNEIEGVVLVAFTVDTLCQISKKHIVQGIGYGCDEVALKAVNRRFEELLMKVNHAKCHTGQMTVPFNFKLRE